MIVLTGDLVHSDSRYENTVNECLAVVYTVVNNLISEVAVKGVPYTANLISGIVRESTVRQSVVVATVGFDKLGFLNNTVYVILSAYKAVKSLG